MRTTIGRLAPLAGLAMLALGGCVASAGSQAKLPADFPLFTNADGSSTLTVTVVDAQRKAQDFADLEGVDRVRFTLSSSTKLTASKVASNSVTLGASQTYTSVFGGLRPGGDYYLKADLYKQSDLLSESSFTQNIVRGEGVAGPLTLTAGAATSATIKVNSVGVIAFTGSTSSNVVSDFSVVEGDTVTVDTAMTSTNNPLVKRIEIMFRSANGSQRGTTMSTTSISGSNTTFSWEVPSYITSGSSDLGTLYVTGYDATSGGNQIAYKTKAVTVYKGASVTPVQLN